MNDELKDFFKNLIVGILTVVTVVLLFYISNGVWYIVGQILKYLYWTLCSVIIFSLVGYGIRYLGGMFKS